MKDESNKSISLRITSSDLHTIRRVLHSYTKELRRSDPPLPTRDELLKTIGTIGERIALVTMQDESRTLHTFDLSPDELTLIDRALTTYVASIGQSVPPSEERDEIMRGCESLRVYIMSSCTPPDASSS